MSLRDQCEKLKTMCVSNTAGIPPYLVRTRFERNLYGVLSAYTKETIGTSPNGLTKAHIESFLISQKGLSTHHGGVMRLGADIYEAFTYLCDTSNWSNDGQDPRFSTCMDDVIRLCDLIEVYLNQSKDLNIQNM